MTRLHNPSTRSHTTDPAWMQWQPLRYGSGRWHATLGQCAGAYSPRGRPASLAAAIALICGTAFQRENGANERPPADTSS
jgi:hypothetical protein